MALHGELVLKDDWLPESSAESIEELDACVSTLVRLPPNMRRLKKVWVNGCECLARDWLPESSRQHPEFRVIGEVVLSSDEDEE